MRKLRKTHEQFIEELKEEGITVIPYDQYIGIKNKIRFKCIVCGSITAPKTPDSVLHGKNKFNCNKCNSKDISQRLGYSNDEFVKAVKKDKPYIDIVGVFSGVENNITFKCNLCNKIYTKKASNLLYSKYGCEECYMDLKNTRALSQDEVMRRIGEMNKQINVRLEYKNQTSRAECTCLKCNHAWSPMAISLMEGYGCPKCGKVSMADKQRKKHDEYLKQIHQKYGDAFRVVSEYTGAYKPIDIFCSRCNNTISFTNARALIKRGVGCPICGLSYGASKVHEYLTEKAFDIKREVSFEDLKGDSSVLRFDFAIIENNEIKCLIEYDGEYHYLDKSIKGYKVVDLKKQQQYDRLKDDYCKKRNIPLIRIPYWEIDNIPNILQEELKKYVNTEISQKFKSF